MAVAKPELGTKRVCPETGRKFYDLNKDPIVSPYTGVTYPRGYFESGSEKLLEQEEVETKELDAEEDQVEIVPLEDAEEGAKEDGDDLPDLGDEDVELGDEDDTFLADEEEDDEDVTGIIGVGEGEDEI